MKQEYILRDATLALSEHIEKGAARSGRVTIKQTRSREYLTVSTSQFKILERFKKAQRVPDLLPSLIYDRACPHLKEFYELILQAVDTGVLYDAKNKCSPETAAGAVRFPFGLGPKIALPMIWLSFGFGLITPIFQGLELPISWRDLLSGIGLNALAGSIGSLLAATHLRWAGGEIYRPFLRLNLLAPHLDFDLSDCLLQTKAVQMRMALLRISPYFLLFAAALVYLPGLSYVVLMSLLLVLIPANGSPAIDYIRTRFSQDARSTDINPIFNPNRVLSNFIQLKGSRINPKYVLTRLGYILLWLITVYIINLRLFDVNHPALLREVFEDHRLFPAVVLLAMSLAIILSASSAIVLLLRNLFSLRPWQRKPKKRETPPLESIGIEGPEGIQKFLKGCYIIEQLGFKDSAIQSVAEAGKPVRFRSREDIVVESDPGDTFYIILSGKVRIIRTNQAGREVKCGDLGTGDGFGEVALLHEGIRTRTARALGKVWLLAIDRHVFHEIILAHANEKEFEAILQRQSFINRLPFTVDWPPHTVRQLGRRMRMAEYRKGTRMLRRGEDNRFFFIVYEGLFKVEINGKRIDKVGPGEFLGEISLLQNSLVQADVIALEDSKCLYLDKREFINFISAEFVVSLYFEKVSSKRLKRPIFPYLGKSFDVYSPH